MNKTPENKSLFLYTVLIFLIALIIIILTFFGQDRILKQTNEQIETATSSITERATILSNENMQLSERIISLEKDLESEKKNIDAFKKRETEYENLFECHYFISAGDFENAKLIFDKIDNSVLSEKALVMYNEINAVLIPYYNNTLPSPLPETENN